MPVTTILIEVKLGFYPHVVDEAAESLLRFARQLDGDSVLVVVTGGGPSYRRPDGVNVVPVTQLGP